MIFKAKINTTNVALNISCKAGSLRNAKNFAFDCKTYCCKTRMYGTVKNAPINMYYVAPETPIMSSVIADCPHLVPPPNILDKSTTMHETIGGLNSLPEGRELKDVIENSKK